MTEDLSTIKTLKERVWLLEDVVRELLIYAAPFTHEAAALCKEGYTSELVPRFTRIGPVQIADRIEEIRRSVSPESTP